MAANRDVPGGRTDDADDDAGLLERSVNFHDAGVARHFWFAAVREVFEETGVLLARAPDESWLPDTAASERMQALRLRLLDEDATLLGVLEECNARTDFGDVVYFAHWITPIAEPRRYDTRFFVARLPGDRQVRADSREMTDAVWLSPVEALHRFAEGKLPMVFPTVRTLEQLKEFRTTSEALDALRERVVHPIMPRLVRTATGVGIVIDPK